MEEILCQARQHETYLIELRRRFHRHPELSGREEETVRGVAEELSGMGIRYTVVQNGGVLAEIQGGQGPGRTVMLRADMDALPVEEARENLLQPKNAVSQTAGISHVCGHDAHTAMLLTAARVLNERRERFPGRVLLLFERGEEATYNIIHLMKHLHDRHEEVDTCYACHVASFADSGTLVVFDRAACAGSFEFDVRLTGRGGHGSRPDEANSPVDCFAAVYGAMQSLHLRHFSPFLPLTFSVGRLRAGEAKNIIPETLSFGGTFRVFDMDTARAVQAELRELIPAVCAAYGCQAEVELSAVCAPVVNHPACVQMAREAIGAAIGPERIRSGEPWMGSESFSVLSEMWPSVYAGLGIRNAEKGTGAAHHSPEFDVDEEVLVLGTASYVAYAEGFLRSGPDVAADRYPGGIAELYLKNGWDDGVFAPA